MSNKCHNIALETRARTREDLEGPAHGGPRTRAPPRARIYLRSRRAKCLSSSALWSPASSASKPSSWGSKAFLRGFKRSADASIFEFFEKRKKSEKLERSGFCGVRYFTTVELIRQRIIRGVQSLARA